MASSVTFAACVAKESINAALNVRSNDCFPYFFVLYHHRLYNKCRSESEFIYLTLSLEKPCPQ